MVTFQAPSLITSCESLELKYSKGLNTDQEDMQDAIFH